MAITVTIVTERENKDDKTVYFTVQVKENIYKFHADMPKLDDPLIWLETRKEKIHNIIKAKITAGTFRNEHPKWVEALEEIEAISNLADAKVFLKKLVRYIGK